MSYCCISIPHDRKGRGSFKGCGKKGCGRTSCSRTHAFYADDTFEGDWGEVGKEPCVDAVDEITTQTTRPVEEQIRYKTLRCNWRWPSPRAWLDYIRETRSAGLHLWRYAFGTSTHGSRPNTKRSSSATSAPTSTRTTRVSQHKLTRCKAEVAVTRCGSGCQLGSLRTSVRLCQSRPLKQVRTF